MGRTHYNDFAKEKDVLASSVHSFNPVLESWAENKPSGAPPPGLHSGASASEGHHLYLFGGYDGSHLQCSLHQLDTRSWVWKQLSSGGGPMRKGGAGMVTCGSKLVLFGGYGVSTGSIQPGAKFVADNKFTNGTGWTNELHTFDLRLDKGVLV